MAEYLGVSVSSVKQARMDPASAGYRAPPPGWEKAVLSLPRARKADLEELEQELGGRG